MNLLKRNPRRSGAIAPPALPVNRFRSEIDQLFNRFFTGDPWMALDFPVEAPFAWTPAIDVVESDDAMTVRAEIPGLELKDIDVRVRDNILTISGEKSDEFEDKRKDSWYCERSFGSFNRTLELPANVDASKINAEYANGVLTIKLPRPATIAARQIEVKPAGKAAPVSTPTPAAAPVQPSYSPSSTQRVAVGAGR